MKKRLIFSSAVLILIMMVSPPALAQTPAATSLTITGQLMNETSGQPAPASISLMLHIFENRQMINMVDGQTGPDGTFAFENVETTPDRFFGVMATVGQTSYFSEIKTSPTGPTTLELPVTIYDTTSDAGAIRVEQMHTLVDFFSPTLLQISDVYVISNEGERTVEGAVTLADGQRAALEFTLPENAQNLSFERGELGQRYFQTPTGFADTSGVPPGQNRTQIMVRYYLPYGGELNLTRFVPYPTTKVGVIIPQVGITFTSNELTKAEGVELPDGREANIFSVDNLQPGQAFTLNLAGQPALKVVSATPEFTADEETAALPPSTTVRWPLGLGVGLMAAGAGLIGGGIWQWRRALPKPEPGGDDIPPTDPIPAITGDDENTPAPNTGNPPTTPKPEANEERNQP